MMRNVTNQSLIANTLSMMAEERQRKSSHYGDHVSLRAQDSILINCSTTKGEVKQLFHNRPSFQWS